MKKRKERRKEDKKEERKKEDNWRESYEFKYIEKVIPYPKYSQLQLVPIQRVDQFSASSNNKTSLYNIPAIY